ncbi:P-loop containing nucleoside triphosphate hydrolase protein [Parasitella parasitica]|nr:P-loop containing nucleoside triphosphate hydrolase protein [Parasitella parasitica]
MTILSLENCKPGIANVSFQRLAKLAIQPGTWVKVFDEQSKVYHCSIWPADIPDNLTLVNKFIQYEADEAESGTIKPIDKVVTAIKADLTYRVNTEATDEQQLIEFGFVFDRATAAQRISYVRGIVDSNVICKGAIIRKSPIFSIEVTCTYPDESPVFLASASMVNLVNGNRSDQGQVCELEKSVEALSLAPDFAKTNNTSSLQKAYIGLYEVVCFPFLYKDWINQLGIECPKGVLLYGPPGVGKTFLVLSIARQCKAKMFTIQGPEVFGPFIGESEKKLRAKFTDAKDYAISKNVPVILFIDEIDALTPKRDNAQSHENRMVAQLLTLMDGIESRGRLVIVGATNRPNSIDPALRRPGRFDREIHMEPPSVMDRLALLKAQTAKLPLDSSVDMETLASMTNGYVAADINSMCREAAMSAVQRASKEKDPKVIVGMVDFKLAFAAIGPSMTRGFQVQVDQMKWDDVGGLEDVKKRLKQAVEWPLLYKESFHRLGLKPPRGILLYGPPGCSKTTLVKVIASSANVSFLSINGAQLYSPFVGDSEKAVRTIFQKARASAPAIIFLDETEAIVGKRNLGDGGSSGDSVQERLLSTLLNEMDGVENAESILVVGATNRPDMLDAALMRPGRFDQALYVPPPDEKARLEILKIHTKHMPIDANVDLLDIAKRTKYYTGADLQNVCREAAMVTLRSINTGANVTMSDFNKSVSTIPPSLKEESIKLYSKKPHSSKQHSK